MHFHAEKDETWYVLSGEFIVHWINTKDATTDSRFLKQGDVWRNEKLFPHQLVCQKEGCIIEVSTKDDHMDNYRVFPGDSQK
jgi:mannose-6-phosphate isomerase-like protein (cupin superfamily)